MVERFKITYRNGAYYVDRPNWDGGEVVAFSDYAELEAENARLTKALSEALSRTGAVKVEGPAIKEFRRIFHTTRFTTDIRYQPELIAAVLDEISSLSTLEPAAPEGQQPVAHVIRKGFSSGVLGWTGYGQKADLPDGTMLYTRLSETSSTSGEQAVTEAMVDKFIERYELGCSHRYDRNSIRAALKAAMEAG